MTLPEAAEIVAGWMDPDMSAPMGKWRVWVPVDALSQELRAVAIVPSLDSLREVEARLSEEQRYPYLLILRGEPTPGLAWRSVHASAEQKLLALGEVLIRP